LVYSTLRSCDHIRYGIMIYMVCMHQSQLYKMHILEGNNGGI